MSTTTLKSIVTALMIAGSLSNALAESGNWNQWRGPNRDGRLSEGALPSQLSGNLEQVWVAPHSPSYSGPVIFDGLLYTTETIDKADERVTAYELATGEQIWTRQWPGSMSVPFFAASNGDWIRATPACSSDGLVVAGMRDVLVCLDPKTGNEKWRVDFPKQMGSPLPMFGTSCSPLIDGDVVYMQTGGETVCLSMRDGSVVWRTLNNADSESPGAFSSPSIATIAGKRQLLVQTRLELCGVDPADGRVLWKQPIEAFRGMNILTPLAISDRVFTSAHSGVAQMFELSQADNVWSVKKIWQQKQQAYMSSPVAVDGKVLIHLKNERMACLDAASGDMLYTTRPLAKYMSLATDGDRVLGLTNLGRLLLFDGTADEYTPLDEAVVGKDSWAHVAVCGNYVVVRDLSELKVFRFRP